MATSPTSLADTPPVAQPAPTTSVTSSGFPLIPLLISVAAGILVTAICVGGVVYFLVRTGRFPVQSSAVSRKQEQAETNAAHIIVLEPMLVNLADDGASYLRLALTLRVLDTDKKADRDKDEKSDDGTVPAVRDTVLAVLGKQTSADLLAPDGKDRLKSKLKSALATYNSQLKVSDVFFTDYLVQR